MEALQETRQVRELIAQCLDGDPEAARRFQDAYGELIYGYPQRVFHRPAEEAGDFYLFAFQGGRIFRRLRTFEGRAPLRAYLLGFVLDDLVLEWRRAERSLDTIPIDEVNEMTLQEAGESGSMSEINGRDFGEPSMGDRLEQLDVSKVVVFKLLHAEDYELSAAEIRYIANSSGRTVAAVVAAVEELRGTIRDRETALRALEDSLESVQAWIQLYQRRLRRVGEDLASLQPTSTAAERLRGEQAEIERKITRREQQREKLLQQARRRKITAPYKDIATILNTTIGNVGSQISRLREELARLSETSGELSAGKDSLDHEAH